MLATVKNLPWTTRKLVYTSDVPWSRCLCRCLSTLAIETSCDDTSVAILEVGKAFKASNSDTRPSGKVVFHRTITANSAAHNGIHPLVALHSHQTSLANLVAEALATWAKDGKQKPDFVSVTRGPGMRSNLSVGLDLAKGLAVAWGVPLVGVHHMQAHALTPRLCYVLESVLPESNSNNARLSVQPAFPYLTVLASGGHTLLLRSSGLIDHQILAETGDIAIGDCLDKAARAVLPDDQLIPPYGKALHDFAFPGSVADYNYCAPATRTEELTRRPTKWGWSLGPPLADSKGGDKTSRRMVYSFAGLLSSVERFMRHTVNENGTVQQQLRAPDAVPTEERRDMAREVLRVAFEHLASRILLCLADEQKVAKSAKQSGSRNVSTTVVVSGGVASSGYLRHLLKAMLEVRGFEDISVIFPPADLCTDNALMIAWAGLEMYNAGYRSTLDVAPLRKWSLDSRAEDGGILGIGGWVHAVREVSS